VRQADIKTEIFKAPDSIPAEPQVAGSVAQPEVENTPPPPVLQAEPKGVLLDKTELVTPGPASQYPPPPVQQKSRAGLYIGIFIVLFVIGGLAAGGGWYAYTKYQTAAPPAATPTPEVVVAPAATPMTVTQTDPTPELTENPANAAPTNTQTVSGPGPQRTNPAPSRDVPAKTNPGTAAKTPAKTKGKDDRTVILQ